MGAVEMGSDIMLNLLSFMKIGTGVQVVLRFCFSFLRGCNVSITIKGIYEVRR
jgi:hypothetical protein